MWKKAIITVLVVVALGIMAFEYAPGSKGYSKTAESGVEKLYDPIVVLELYTSQGCSSCPAADILLNTIKNKKKANIFTLSYHVDYWNYMGWKDPFSSPLYAEKQRLYNQKFSNKSSYTPQVVINGKEHFVGSHVSKMSAKIATYTNKKVANKVEIYNIQLVGNTIDFNYKIEGVVRNKKIRTVLVLDERTTHVKRGENRNRTLKNSNVVVSELMATLEKNMGKINVVLPASVMPNEKMHLMVFTENEDYDITGAAKSTIDW